MTSSAFEAPELDQPECDVGLALRSYVDADLPEPAGFPFEGGVSA
jgi:hypothetical protein